MEHLTESISNQPTIVLGIWQNWCRLCGKSNLGDAGIKYESFGNLTFIIQRHFSISLSDTDTATGNLICTECYEFIGKLEQFAEKCVKVDVVFNKILSINSGLQNDNNYLQALRYEAGLDTEEKFPLTELVKQDKSTDTGDLSSVDDFSPLKYETVTRKKSTRTRKPRKIQIKTDYLYDDEEAIESEYLLDNDNHDIDPSFDMDGVPEPDQDSTDSNNDSMDERMDSITVSELEIVKPKSRRRKTNPFEAGPIKCPLCNAVFDKKQLFDTHMREHHPDAENPFICSNCPKNFPTLRRLHIHEAIHLPDNLKYVHPCEFCDKRFSKLVNVQAHIRAIHTGDRPFICEECGKSFVAKGGLKEHKILHSNEYPIQCPHCPKRFKNAARLRIHEDIHKHTAYICPHCGLQLNTKRTLHMHMVVHSDQKKFKCQYCGNEYKRSKTLKNHLIIHTGLRPYTCPWCDKTFANGSNCRSHKKKAHPVELAALEASGQPLPAVNIPKMDQLKQQN